MRYGGHVLPPSRCAHRAVQESPPEIAPHPHRPGQIVRVRGVCRACGTRVVRLADVRSFSPWTPDVDERDAGAA